MAQTTESNVPAWLVRWAAVCWRLLIIAASLVAIGYVFTKLRLIIVPVVAALFVSTILVPPATWLRRRGFPPLLATWTVFLGSVVIIGLVVYGLYTVTEGQFNQLGHDLSRGVDRLEGYFTNGPFHLSHKQVNDYTNQAKNFFTKNQGTIVQGALSGATIALEIAGGILLTLVLTFFFVKDGDQMSRWALTLFSGERVEDMRTLGRETWRTMAAYIRGTTVNGLVNAVLMSIGLVGLGVPLVLPVAVLTFVGGYLPIVGAIVSGAFAALVALVTKGPIAAAIVVGITIVIHNVEGYIVGPKVLGHEVRLHPVAIILILAVGTALGGIIGAFFAVPLAAVLLVINEHYRRRRRQLALDAEERAPPGPSPEPEAASEPEPVPERGLASQPAPPPVPANPGSPEVDSEDTDGRRRAICVVLSPTLRAPPRGRETRGRSQAAPARPVPRCRPRSGGAAETPAGVERG